MTFINYNHILQAAEHLDSAAKKTRSIYVLTLTIEEKRRYLSEARTEIMNAQIQMNAFGIQLDREQ